VCAFTVLALTSTLALEGQNQNPSSPLSLVPIQSRGPQDGPQKIVAVPTPDPSGPNVTKLYPQPPGQQPVTDACYVQITPPAGCMFTPDTYDAGTPCSCTNGKDIFQGKFLLY
jgi:hypothetical protein